MNKKLIVHGYTTVTVHCVIDVDEEEYKNGEITEEEIYEKATEQFGGIEAFCGNGGYDKLIGVEGSNESISADESVTFDDYQEA